MSGTWDRRWPLIGSCLLEVWRERGKKKQDSGYKGSPETEAGAGQQVTVPSSARAAAGSQAGPRPGPAGDGEVRE